MRRFVLTYQREGHSMDIEGVEFSSLLDKPVVLELYPDDEHTSPPVFRDVANMEFHLNEFGETSIKWLDPEKTPVRRFILTYECENQATDREGVQFSNGRVSLESHPHGGVASFPTMSRMERELNESGKASIQWIDEEVTK